MADSKQYINITVQKGEHSFSLHIPVGCTWGVAIDAAIDIAQEVSSLAQKWLEQSRNEQQDSTATPIVSGE